MTLTRRSLLIATAAVPLAGCASKFRRYDGPPVTGIVVMKAQRQMHLLSGNQALRSFRIELGGDPIGPKTQEGDLKTPEGAYWIDRKNPNSSYHLSLGISYPNDYDRAQALARGVRPGGDIFIHGTPRENRRDDDWTAGCIAVRNREVEDIYAMVREGTPITIYA